MTESGFKYFIEFMQARNAPPKPKPKKSPKAQTATLPPQIQARQHSRPCTLSGQSYSLPEDYTGSVCLLHILTRKTPTYEEVLIDAADLAALSAFSWRINHSGKLRRKYVVSNRREYLARVLVNPGPRLIADHINHKTLDNRRSNLRAVSSQGNNLNSRQRANGTSKYRGVSWCASQNKWLAQAGTRSTKRVYLGHHTEEVDAARAYNEYAKKAYGSVVYLNPV